MEGEADYNCDGVNDDIEFQRALDALPSVGGKIRVLAGNYSFSETVSRAIDNVTIEGADGSTCISNDNTTPLFSAGTQTNWLFSNLKTDDGGIDIVGAQNITLINLMLGSTSYSLTTFFGVVAENLTSASLTSGYIPYVSKGGLLSDESGFEYDPVTDTLTAVNIRSSGLTAGRIVYVGANGLLADESGFAYDTGTDTLTAVNIASTGLTQGRVAIVGEGGLVSDDSGLTYEASTDTLTVSILNSPTGRTATYTIAASDAPSPAIAQADYVCDGIADNVEIQSAINAVADYGGTIHLTSGTFKISDTINLPGGVSLRGEGMAAFAKIGTTIWLESGSNCDMIHISGLVGGHRLFGGIEYMQIRGNSQGNTDGDGIVVDNADGKVTDLLFRSIYIADIVDNGIVLDTGWYTRFDTVWVEFCDVGVYLTTNYSGDVWFSQSNLTCNVTSLLIKDNSFIDLQFIGGCIGYDDENSVIIDNSGQLLFSDVLFWGQQAVTNTYDAIVIRNGSENIIIDSCTFKGQSKTRYAVNIQDISCEVIIANSVFDDYTGSVPVVDNGAHNIVENNIGYIGHGETRTDSGSITGGPAGSILFAWHNPEDQDILIKKVVINVTASDASAANIDCGIADNASYINGGTEFFNNLRGEVVQVNDSWSSGTGMQTLWVSCQDNASSTDGWVVARILDNDGSDLEGVYYIEYIGA